MFIIRDNINVYYQFILKNIHEFICWMFITFTANTNLLKGASWSGHVMESWLK